MLSNIVFRQADIKMTRMTWDFLFKNTEHKSEISVFKVFFTGWVVFCDQLCVKSVKYHFLNKDNV